MYITFQKRALLFGGAISKNFQLFTIDSQKFQQLAFDFDSNVLIFDPAKQNGRFSAEPSIN